MPKSAPKSAIEKLNAKKEPKIVVLNHAFAGASEGQILFVATPRIVADYILKIPPGETRTVRRMRGDLALRRGCDLTCPMSTSIFVRIAAEAAIAEMESGKPACDVIPFWRIIAGDDKIARKLPINAAWIDEQRAAETGDRSTHAVGGGD